MTTPILASYWTLAGDSVPMRDVAPSPRDFRDRVEAAGGAGFTGFGLFFADLPSIVDRYGHAGMQSIFADNGITQIELEVLIDWFADGERGAAATGPRDLLLRTSEAFGGCHIKACGDVSGDWPIDRMTESFAKLCDLAGDSGSRVSLEMVAFSNIASLSRARALVEGANRPNGGLMLDIWHFVRGCVDFAEIAALPGDLIFGVELNDAADGVQGTLFEDTVSHRRFCGAGDFDIAGFVDAVRASGYRGAYGIEVLSHEVRAMPLAEAARTAFDTTARALQFKR